jgi:hypothetical protein
MNRDDASCKECRRLLKKFPAESTLTVRTGKSQQSSIILNGSIAEALYELHLISVHGMKK